MSPRRNPNPIEEGIARAFYLAVLSTEMGIMEEMDDSTLAKAGVVHPRSFRQEIDDVQAEWDMFGLSAPKTPAWAYVPADELYEQIEMLNDKPMMALVSEAEIADRRRMAIDLLIVVPPEITEEEYLNDFGLALGWIAAGMDPGEAWFDEHASFDLKFPRDFDFYEDFDGELGLKYGPKPSKRRRGASGRRAR